MQLGFTWSHRYAQSLAISQLTIPKIASNEDWQWIRIGSYWDEYEPKHSEYNWHTLDELVTQATTLNLKIIMTLGSKAPRWPEFYFPNWVDKNNFQNNFLKSLPELIKRYKNDVSVWQIENEPLDPSGPANQKLSLEFLTEEINILNSLDTNKPKLINIWANDKRHGIFSKLNKVNDFQVLGLDWYPWQLKPPFLRTFGSPTKSSDWKTEDLLIELKHSGLSSKKLWITELQLEPWIEESLKIEQHVHNQWNWEDRLKSALSSAKPLSAEVILIWGMEYWAWKEKNKIK